MDIPGSVRNIERYLLDSLYVEAVLEGMVQKDKIKELEKEVRSLTRKIARGK